VPLDAVRFNGDGIRGSAAKRALRGVAIRRRNYLFAGADSGGERAAAIHSLIGMAKLNGIDPEAWFRHMLATIAYHPVNRVDPALALRRIAAWHLKHTAPQRCDGIIVQPAIRLKTVLS
jgi:hypothetical protein